ncbi:tetratricopeptide repeat-containing sensor histidine kinase [Ferruginibacter sp.]|nr:sensor histidine kinase [Ferruginibacter sp.]
MPRIFIFIAILLGISLTVVAQNKDISDLLPTLKNSKEDTSRITILNDIQAAYLDANNDSALFYNKQAEALINKLHAEPMRHRCYHAFVKIYHAKFDNAMAVEYCLKAIAAAAQFNDDFQKANSYRALFSLYWNLRKKDSAIKYSAYAMDLTERIKDTNNVATMYGNLSRIYNEMELYDKGIAYGKKGVELGERYKDFKGMLISLNNLGNCYITTDRNAEAIPVFERLLIDGQKYKRSRSVLNALINLGVIYYDVADENNMSRIATKMKDMEPSFDEADRNGASYRHLVYGYDYTLQKRFDVAEKEFMDGLKIAEADSIIAPMQSLYLAMSVIKYAEQDFAAAAVWDNKWGAVDQSMKKQEMAEYAVDLEAKYATESKEAKIKLQASQLKQKSTINYILIGSAAALLIILVLIFINYRHKQKLQQQRIAELETQQQLTATEAVLKGEEQERTRLAKDLHDGLGGMLSGIKYSFNNMKGNMVMTPDNAQAFERSMDMLDSSIKEMRRVAHNMMPEALVKFGLDTALKDFCNDINNSGALQVSYQSIGMEGLEIDQTVAITIYRIVQELINNTMKHAVAKTAIVQITNANNQFAVTVEDDGKGFDTAILNQSKGIGWSNIQSRIDFLKGKLDVKSTAGTGTSVHIEIAV